MCPAFFQNISVCIEGANGIPNRAIAFNFINDGCSTFGNQADVYDQVQRIQSQLPKGFTLSVSGNQTIAGGGNCATRFTLDITPTTTQETFSPCDLGGTCHRLSYLDETRCTSSTGAMVWQKCCDTLDTDGRNALRWFRGQSCPDIPCRFGQSCYPRNSQGSCVTDSGQQDSQICCAGAVRNTWNRGNSCPAIRTFSTCIRRQQSYWCSDADSAALDYANACLDAYQESCRGLGSQFNRGSCRRTQQNGTLGVFGTCNVQYTCPWNCIQPDTGPNA